MLTIGLGKHKGCSRLHQENINNFATVLPKAAKVVIEKLPVAFAIALIENAHEHLHTICAVPAEEIMEKEPELLKLSKSLMPKLQFDHLDVLVVQQIGKDITGDSMAPISQGAWQNIRPQNIMVPILRVSSSTILVRALTEM